MSSMRSEANNHCFAVSGKMPFSWGKSSSKDVKKQRSIDTLLNGMQSWLRPASSKDRAITVKDGRFSRTKSSLSDTRCYTKSSKSLAPSTTVTRSPSFAEHLSQGQPLPLPCFPPLASRTVSRNRTEQGDGLLQMQSLSSSPLPSPSQVLPKVERLDLEGGTSGYGSGSVSSASSLSSGDVTDLWPGNGAVQTSSFMSTVEGNGAFPARKNRSRSVQGRGTRHSRRRSAADVIIQSNPLPGLMTASCSPKVISGVALGEASPCLYAQANASASSMSNSSFSSPTRSPIRAANLQQSSPLLGVPKSALFQYEQVVPRKQSLNFRSGDNSGPNSSIGDAASQNHWRQDSASAGHSPIPSPKNQHVLSSRTSVIPLSPVRGTPFLASDLATSWHEDKRRSGHPLPLPPTIHPISSPFASSSAPSSPSSVTLYNSPPVRWQKGKLLGGGTFGNVYKGFSDSGTFCAMKEVLITDDPKSKESIKQLVQEVHVLIRLRHPNIVQYFGSETLEDRLYIYLEYISGGSIHKLLQEYGRFKEPVIRCFTRQILLGLAYLHSMNTVHRDIKGANILVDTNGEVKLADFGMAKHINAQSIPLSFKGSPYWMAPEVFKNINGYNYPVDIWSLGCTVIEMASAKPPWSQYEGVAAMFKIGNSKEIPSIPNYLSKDGQDFLKLCLQRKPGDRPSAAQLLEHPFVKSSMNTCKPDETTDRSDAVVALMVENNRRKSKDAEISQDVSRRKSRMQISPSSEHSPRMHQRLVSSVTSPAASPKLQPRGMYHTYGGFSSSPICTPLICSGSSTPLTGGYGSSPFTAAGSFRIDGNNGEQKPLAIGAHVFDSRINVLRSRSESQPHELHSQVKHQSSDTDILGMALGRVHHDTGVRLQRSNAANGSLA